MRKTLPAAIITLLLCIPALAQQQPQQTAGDPEEPAQQVFMPPPAVQAAPAQKSDSTKPSQTKPAAASNASGNASSVGPNDRLFFILPNYGTLENSEHVQPLTPKQKFDVQLKNCFDPVVFPYVAFLAGISQANDSDPEYGQGALGYARRYGAGFLDSTDENFMVGAVYPTLFREDPRYFQMGKGSFLRRTGYSVSRIFVIRTDAGNSTFNFSEILGSATAASIGSTYRSGDERTVGDIASDWGTLIGWDTVSNLMKEFWPDIHRKFQHIT
jgi:hypothetical protein